MVAMLAMSPRGERSRNWLQAQLWGSRGPQQARGSLRRELSNLRERLNEHGEGLLVGDRDVVRLDLSQISVDARDPLDAASGRLARVPFLEGIDIGENGFEEWLREQRDRLSDWSAGEPPRPVASDPIEPRVELDATLAGFAGRPAIAVLAFQNLTGTADDDYLAEELAEDLIDRLSRLRWLPVIARASSFTIDQASVSLEEIGHRLGAKYLVQGRLLETAGRKRLAIDLLEAATRRTLLTRRAEADLSSSETERAALAAEVVASLKSATDQAEQVAALAKPADAADVLELVWRGRWHFNRLTKADATRANELFEEALARDPNSVEALVNLTWAMQRTLWVERASPEQVRHMRALAQRIISLDGEDARGYMLAGVPEIWLRRPDRAQALLRRAIELNPSLVAAHGQLGSALFLDDQPRAAFEPLRTALRLSPSDHEVFYVLSELAMSHSLLGEWSSAIEYAEQSTARRSGYWHAHVVKINALVRLGEPREALEALQDLRQARPNFTSDYIDWLPFSDVRWNRHFKEGLAMAGAANAANAVTAANAG